MKILVTGDRYWGDRNRIYRELQQFRDGSVDDADWIIEGAAPGADYAAGMAAEKLGLRHISVPALWKFYGKAAGPLRNGWMLDLEPDLVLAFHGNIEQSKGTKDCVTQAEKRGIKVCLISK